MSRQKVAAGISGAAHLWKQCTLMWEQLICSFDFQQPPTTQKKNERSNRAYIRKKCHTEYRTREINGATILKAAKKNLQCDVITCTTQRTTIQFFTAVKT